MAYGDNSTAAKILAQGSSEAYIKGTGTEIRRDVIEFVDKSFIELRKFDNHQAFLSNGWNVTPR